MLYGTWQSPNTLQKTRRTASETITKDSETIEVSRAVVPGGESGRAIIKVANFN